MGKYEAQEIKVHTSEPAIPQTEFKERVRKTRDLMQRRSFDALLIFSSYLEREGNVCYLTNHHIAFPLGATDKHRRGLGYSAVLLTEDTSTLFADLGYQKELVFGVDSVKFGPNVIANIVDVIKEKRLDEGNIGLVGTDIIHVGFYGYLKRFFPNMTLENADEILETQRMIKSPIEMRVMGEAAKIADEGLRAGIESAEEGIREYEVGLAASKACMNAGADYVVRTRVHSGKWTAITARWPLTTGKKIEKGDIVSLDLIGWYKNYAFDVLRTTIVGKPTDKQRDLLDKSVEVIENQIKAIRPGRTAEELNNVVINFSKEIGYEKYISPFGHGIGIDVVENPYILAGSKTILEQGMILCIEPGIMIPEFAGVRIEDEVIVTETGVEVLTKVQKIFW